MDVSLTSTRPLSRPRDLQALGRLVALAHWVRLQAAPFRFCDAQEAFRDHQRKSPQASERMWSRDKRALTAAGVVLERSGANEYAFDPACLRRPSQFGRVEVAAIHDLAASTIILPPPIGFDLDLGLRKILVLGAPVADVLSTRPSPTPAHGPAQLLRAALLLIAVVADAGFQGVGARRVRRLVGVLDEVKLNDVTKVLQDLDIPDAAPPRDSLGIEDEGGILRLTMSAWPVPRLALTPGEVAALRLGARMAGIHRGLDFLDRVAWRPTAGAHLPTFAEIQGLAA